MRNDLLNLKKQPSLLVIIFFICTFFLLWFFRFGARGSVTSEYNSTGPWTFGVVSDMDEKSWDEQQQKWRSILRFATLSKSNGKYSVSFDQDFQLLSNINAGGRGMELSTLSNYKQKLYTCDDRTGIVYEIMKNPKGGLMPVGRHILMDGNGDNSKGFKCEWTTEKDGDFVVGGFGKEYTGPDGQITNLDPMYIKIISPTGRVTHMDWKEVYDKVRKAVGSEFPGYLFHESVTWNSDLQKWYFLPRRQSVDPYNSESDEFKGSNLMIVCSSDFVTCDAVKIGTKKDPKNEDDYLNPEKGFSAAQFIPDGTNAHMIALKSREVKGETSSYLVIFDTQGKILMDEIELHPQHKFEGVAFFPHDRYLE